MASRIPSLRRKNEQAVVTFTDAKTGKRRDFYCGPWGSTEARRKYGSLIGQWEAAGRCWPCDTTAEGLSVAEIVVAYWRWAEGYYAAGECWSIKSAWKILVECHGATPAESFGPIRLREVRDAMIAKGWCRKNVNKQCGRVITIFKWAAGQEMIPVTIYQALKTMEPLKRGRCTAPESDPVRPVADEHVDALRPWLSRQVWALIELQRLTGARPGELLTLRLADIDRSCDVWRAELTEHKTLHHGKARAITFGPLAQRVLAEFLLRSDDAYAEFLLRSDDAYLFSPREAENERIEALTQIEGRGHLATGRRRADVGEHYTTASYRRAITRACDCANRWARGGRICGDNDRLIPRWHPHQLRHTAATVIRKRFGLEAAQVVLGHSSANVTDAVYAERDRGKVEDVMRAIG